MKIPLQISFSNMDSSDAVRARIEELAGKLERLHPGITACRVVVRAPNRRQQSGRLYHVSIDLTLPGHEVAINRSSPNDQTHEDVYVAVRDAFEALTKRLDEVTDKMQRKVKAHATVDQEEG